MGDESKDIDYQIWLDEYNETMASDGNLSVGDITINLNDYYSNSDTITITGNDNNWMDYKDWVYTDPNTHNNITLTGGGEEMLRVAEDGFYVRGVKVEADAKEAKEVYKAFKQWLTWASLTKPDED